MEKEISQLEEIKSLLKQQQVINSFLIKHLKEPSQDKKEKDILTLETSLNSLNEQYETVINGIDSTNSNDVSLENEEESNVKNSSEEIKVINNKEDEVNNTSLLEENIKNDKEVVNTEELEQPINETIEVTEDKKITQEDIISEPKKLEKFKCLANGEERKHTIKSILLKNPLAGLKSKQYISVLNKKHNSLLETIGFTAKDLDEGFYKENYISTEQVADNIEKDLKKIKFYKHSDKYENEYLRNLDDETKTQTIYNILWPSLHKHIKECVQVTEILNDFTKTNKFIAILEKFSKKNNLNTEEVINILIQDKDACDNLFKDKKDIRKIKENYNDIVRTLEKFSNFMINNTTILKTLIQVTEDMKEIVLSLDIPENDKSSFVEAVNESQILQIKNKKIFYRTLKNNVNSLNDQLLEKQEVESNEVQKSKVKI